MRLVVAVVDVAGNALRLAFALLSLGLMAVAAGAQELQGPLPGFSAWTGDLDGMEERRLVRIIVPFSKTIYFIDRGQEFGTAVEFGKALEDYLNKGRKKQIEKIRVAFVPTARDGLIAALNEGRGDIIAANLTVTPERLRQVDFTDPFAKGVREILVTGPTAPPVTSLDDLAGKEVRVRASSSYYEHLQKINTMRRDQGEAEILLRPIDENLEDEDLMEMVNAGLLAWCVVDDHKARIWADIFESITLHDDIAVAENSEIAWAIRKNSPELAAALNTFVKEHKVGTTFGNIIKKRYYQNDKMVRAAYAPTEIEKFRTLRSYFDKYGATYSFDALVLAAQGYQESHLDQSKKSPRGAVGIMQLLPSTAADKAVAITGIDRDAARNIEAGAKYLRYLATTYLNEPELDPINQALLALAAYNAGPGNLRRMRAQTVEIGLDPDKWFGNVENGAAQLIGRETVQYVSNIFKYYVAYTLLSDMEK